MLLCRFQQTQTNISSPECVYFSYHYHSINSSNFEEE
jgi:hypothetical protein